MYMHTTNRESKQTNQQTKYMYEEEYQTNKTTNRIKNYLCVQTKTLSHTNTCPRLCIQHKNEQ